MSKMPSSDPTFQYNSSFKIAYTARKLRGEFNYLLSCPAFISDIPKDVERIRNFWTQQELFARSYVQICEMHLRDGAQGLRFFFEYNLREAERNLDAMMAKKQEAIEQVEIMRDAIQYHANAETKENE